MRYESTEQIMFVTRVRAYFPHLVIFAIPNGGSRKMTEAIRLKKEGVLPGVPDLFLPEPRGRWRGLFIEMKRQTNSRVSKEQAELHKLLRNRNFDVAVCYGVEEAWRYLLGYLTRREIELFLPEAYLEAVIYEGLPAPGGYVPGLKGF